MLLFSNLLIQKPKNILLQFIIIYFISRSREIYLSNLLQFYLSFCPWGINNPSLTLGCKYLFFVCRSCLRGVAWFSYWFDNLGFIYEGNTYRHCAASSLPLWGNTDVASSDVKCYYELGHMWFQDEWKLTSIVAQDSKKTNGRNNENL